MVQPLLSLLKQGLTPRQLALCIAVGAVVGCFPVVGTTTTLCLLLSLALRLNLVAMQVVNYAVYPLQLALLIPLMRLGERLSGARAEALTGQGIAAAFHAGLMQTLNALGTAIIHAMMGWLLLAPLMGAAVYAISLMLLRRMVKAAPESAERQP